LDFFVNTTFVLEEVAHAFYGTQQILFLPFIYSLLTEEVNTPGHAFDFCLLAML